MCTASGQHFPGLGALRPSPWCGAGLCCSPRPVAREQRERLCLPRCPAPELGHGPRLSRVCGPRGFFALCSALFSSEPSSRGIAIETELVKIPCGLLIIEFQRQAKSFFQGWELMLGEGGEQPTRPGRLCELPSLRRGAQARARAPGKGPGSTRTSERGLDHTPRLNLRPDGTLGSCLVPQAGP